MIKAIIVQLQIKNYLVNQDITARRDQQLKLDVLMELTNIKAIKVHA